MILSLTFEGLRLDEVYNLPLDVFYMYVDAAERRDASRRMRYLADTTTAIAGVFGGKAAKEHFDDLKKLYEGGGANGR